MPKEIYNPFHPRDEENDLEIKNDSEMEDAKRQAGVVTSEESKKRRREFEKPWSKELEKQKWYQELNTQLDKARNLIFSQAGQHYVGEGKAAHFEPIKGWGSSDLAPLDDALKLLSEVDLMKIQKLFEQENNFKERKSLTAISVDFDEIKKEIINIESHVKELKREAEDAKRKTSLQNLLDLTGSYFSTIDSRIKGLSEIAEENRE